LLQDNAEHQQKVKATDLDPGQDAFPAKETLLRIGSWTIDRSAYVGLPRDLADSATQYISRVLDFIGLDSGPQRLTYNRLDRRNGGAIYPLEVAYQEVGSQAVPIVLLPSPGLLQAVQRWASEEDWGEIRGPEVVNSLDWDALPAAGAVGRAVFFVPGRSSESPIRTPPIPIGTQLSPGIFKHAPPHLKMGKIVLRARDRNAARVLGPLKLGEESGATLIGRLTTIPLSPENERLRLVRLDIPDQKATSWIAYALADACGARRGRSHLQKDGTSSFERPLSSPAYDPSIGKHSLLRIPRPLDLQSRSAPHEEIALDEWFFRSGAPGVVLAADTNSTPFRESLLLVTDPDSLSSDDEPLLIVVFPEAPPLEVVRFLQSVSPVTHNEGTLGDKETEELEQLHEMLGAERADG
jgi:hypothetical protein